MRRNSGGGGGGLTVSGNGEDPSSSSSECGRKEQADKMPGLVGQQQQRWLAEGGGRGAREMEQQKQRQQQARSQIEALQQLLGGQSETSAAVQHDQIVEKLNSPLEPQPAMKSTNHATIVGIALELFWRRIAVMPQKSKIRILSACPKKKHLILQVLYGGAWAARGCSWASQVDEIAKLAVLPLKPVAPPAKLEKTVELGHAFAAGESLAVSQAVFEQPPHHRTMEVPPLHILGLVEQPLSVQPDQHDHD